VRRRTAVAAGLAAVGAGAAAVVAARRRRAVDDAIPALEGGTETTVVTTDGAALHVHVAGPEEPDRPTVVLSHCWTGNMDTWAPVAARLVEDGYRVVRYDHRGHGRSTAPEAEVDVSRLGADLCEVLEAVDARDAVLAGHSMGGMTAMAFAVDHPDVARERLRALVLVATSSGALARVPMSARVAPAVVASPVVERVLGSRPGHVLVRGVHGRHAGRAALLASRDAFVATAATVRASHLRALLGMDLRDRIRSIGLPTTVVVGSRDLMTPPSHARAIAAAIPGARLVVVKGAGHMLPYEATAEVADAIAAAHRRAAAAGPVPA
jgi:pimeloyl-ACP methyl ester carboxylesterase